MNGHDYPGDDDQWLGETDIPCPFCGHPVDWRFDHFDCSDCKTTWDTVEEIERDRNQSPEDDGDRDEPATWWVTPYRPAQGL